MKTTIKLCFVPLLAAVLLAQGPPPGGRGGFGGGPGGPGGFGRGGGGILGAGPASRTPVTGAPYSATETLTRQQTLSNGNQISTTRQSNVYRDSQGRILTQTTVTPPASSGKPAYTEETIFDPVAGYRYVLNSSTMIAYQSPLPKPRGAGTNPRPTPPARPNVVVTTLTPASINGQEATGTQITETIPAGAIGNAQPIQVIRVTWVSTALQVPVEIKTTDPRNGTSDMELTNIVAAEPNVSFAVPAGYTIQQGGGRGGPGAPRGAGRRGRGPGGPQ